MKYFVLNYQCVSSKLTFKVLLMTQSVLSVLLLRQSSWLFQWCQHLRTLCCCLAAQAPALLQVLIQTSCTKSSGLCYQWAAHRLSLNERPQRKLFKPNVCFTGLAQSLGCTLITPEPNLAQRENKCLMCMS